MKNYLNYLISLFIIIQNICLKMKAELNFTLTTIVIIKDIYCLQRHFYFIIIIIINIIRDFLFFFSQISHDLNFYQILNSFNFTQQIQMV